MRYLIIYSLLLLCFCNCSALHKVSNTNLKTTKQNIQLGSIGENDNIILNKTHTPTALPNYKKPIKLLPAVIPFTKATYKAFTKAKSHQNIALTITYVDSLQQAQKPTYLKLDIADRVAVISALNTSHNSTVKTFLKTTNTSKLVNSIAIALQNDVIQQITQADEVFLEETGIQSYAIKTYTNKKLQHTIVTTKGVVFGYQTAQCCWKENKKHHLDIVDLVNTNANCPKKSYKSSKRATKKKRNNVYKL